MRFVSWNVNGLRAVLKKGFEDIVCELDADIVALQETKLQEGQATLDLPQYREYWSYAEKKGYSGTAIFCKEQPLQALHGLGFPHLDTEGRIVRWSSRNSGSWTCTRRTRRTSWRASTIAWSGTTRSATSARARRRRAAAGVPVERPALGEGTWPFPSCR